MQPTLQYTILSVIIVTQSALLLATITLILINRARRSVVTARHAITERAMAPYLQRVVTGTGSAEEVIAAFHALPASVATVQLLSVPVSLFAGAEADRLVALLREEPWVERILQRYRSPFWWRRLEAARTLGLVARPDDRDVLLTLLDDPHPAIQCAALACLPRIPDAAVVRDVLQSLPSRTVMIQRYGFGVLADVSATTIPELVELLRRPIEKKNVLTWIGLAEWLGAPECLAIIAPWAYHVDPDIRLAVVKAMRRYFAPAAKAAILAALDDPDWRIRAQAARGAGEQEITAAIPRLTAGLQDSIWWVRFRCGLSLALMGETGRDALHSVWLAPDAYAQQMALFISGLSTGSLHELAEH